MIASYPWSGGDGGGRHTVTLHALVQHFDQGILRAAHGVEVVHVYGPGHGAQVALLLDEVHLDLQTLLVLVAHPLCTWRVIKHINICCVSN